MSLISFGEGAIDQKVHLLSVTHRHGNDSPFRIQLTDTDFLSRRRLQRDLPPFIQPRPSDDLAR